MLSIILRGSNFLLYHFNLVYDNISNFSFCLVLVARGEILSVLPSTTRKGMDNLHIKSNLVVHQNHPVFQPLKSGNKNLQKFLLQDTPTFDQDSPKKVPKLAKSSYFGGIVSHPSKCAAQSGPGQFLWLIKLSFGRPKIGCECRFIFIRLLTLIF